MHFIILKEKKRWIKDTMQLTKFILIYVFQIVSSFIPLDIISNGNRIIQTTNHQVQKTWSIWKHHHHSVRVTHDSVFRERVDVNATPHRSALMDVIWCVAVAVIAHKKWWLLKDAHVRFTGAARSNVSYVKRKKLFTRVYKVHG